MPEKPVQIFMSYARDDDALPPELQSSEARGFVTSLLGQIAYEWQDKGGPSPTIWCDIRRVASGEPFDTPITSAIDQSSLLLVVLSRNWMESEYCRGELAAFTERWKSDPNIRERIIIIGKNHVDPDKRPALLQNQVGYLFYARQEMDDIEPEKDFFARGKVRDARYFEQVTTLAGFLLRRAARLADRERRPDPEASPQPPQPPQPFAAAHEPPQNRRIVYLAKPAGDMVEAYGRLVRELTGAGYGIVPDPKADLPVDASATDVVDKALAQAHVAIHLLGQRPGFAPEGQEPIAKLQLQRAARTLTVPASERPDGIAFKRVVWAPKVANAGEWDNERDPLAVLSQFDGYVEGDVVEGATLSRFVEALGHLIGAPVIRARGLDKLEPKSRIYVYYDARDAEFGYNVAKALKQRNLTPMWPTIDGTDAENSQVHHNNLRECDSVLLCWATAPDTWVRASSSELADWKMLGRSRMFDWRGLIAGPPPGLPKRMFVDFRSGDEIDVVVDLTTHQEPPKPDDLNQLLSAH
ncbi:hypothetical protein GCM10007874_51310 [Labrys miyagiensis]|uniref:TIR domain-containing protein n=2 Tax=Labrys miyagiensis TaxID=346912 RepID=A0ABQ6CQT3_9HYPH|nr:hypothetical protein GCM10007874_51310 [Labrys miyagiensis]